MLGVAVYNRILVEPQLTGVNQIAIDYSLFEIMSYILTETITIYINILLIDISECFVG